MSDSVPPSPKSAQNVDWRARSTKPPASDPIEIMRELRAALANTVELINALDLRLCQTMLAVATEEHKGNHAHERIDSLVSDMTRLTERVSELEAEAAE